MLRTLLLAVLLAPFGCSAPTQAPPDPATPDGPVLSEGSSADTEEAREALAEARERWDAAGLDGYAMTLRRQCFCPVPDYTGPFDVVVHDGELASVELEGAPVDAERGMTVADLFDLLEDAYDRGAAEVTVEYDEALGFPTALNVDYDVRMADEEIGYRVSDLREVAG